MGCCSQKDNQDQEIIDNQIILNQNQVNPSQKREDLLKNNKDSIGKELSYKNIFISNNYNYNIRNFNPSVIKKRKDNSQSLNFHHNTNNFNTYSSNIEASYDNTPMTKKLSDFNYPSFISFNNNTLHTPNKPVHGRQASADIRYSNYINYNKSKDKVNLNVNEEEDPHQHKGKENHMIKENIYMKVYETRSLNNIYSHLKEGNPIRKYKVEYSNQINSNMSITNNSNTSFNGKPSFNKHLEIRKNILTMNKSEEQLKPKENIMFVDCFISKNDDLKERVVDNTENSTYHSFINNTQITVGNGNGNWNENNEPKALVSSSINKYKYIFTDKDKDKEKDKDN